MPGEDGPAAVKAVADQPEQAEIESRWSQYRQYLGTVRAMFSRSRAQLAALAPVSEPAMHAIDTIERLPSAMATDLGRLTPQTLLEDLETLKGILAAVRTAKPTNKGRGASPRPPKNVEIIKRVQSLSAAKLTDSEICEHLGDSARPQGASWSDLAWPLALKRHPNAVRKWLSEARNRPLR